MDHVAGPLHILLAGKEGRIWFNMICLKLYQFERTTWWCLFVLEFILESILKFILEIALISVLKFVLLGKMFKKSWSPKICIRSTSWRWAHKISMRALNLIHVRLHVDFSCTKSSFGLQAITFLCEVSLDGVHPFD